VTRDTQDKLEGAGLQLVETAELLRAFAEILGAEVVAVERCRHCGGMKPKGQSCGCFDNGGQ
jgi:hypothetical protein